MRNREKVNSRTTCKAHPRFHEDRIQIRPSLTPALRLGLVGTRPTGALALMAQQHEVVLVIYCQSHSVSKGRGILYEIFKKNVMK